MLEEEVTRLRRSELTVLLDVLLDILSLMKMDGSAVAVFSVCAVADEPTICCACPFFFIILKKGC